jgi:hypothetical protein
MLAHPERQFPVKMLKGWPFACGMDGPAISANKAAISGATSAP